MLFKKNFGVKYKIKTQIKLSLTGFMFSIACSSVAADLPTDWNSIRVSGLGGTFTSVAIDETAPFYNPAGVARLRSPRSRKFAHRIAFPNLMIGGNLLALKGIQAAMTSDNPIPTSTSEAVAAPTNWLESDRFGRVMAKAIENPGEHVYAEAQLFPLAILGNKGQSTFLIGLPVRTEFTLGVPDATNLTEAYVHSKTTMGGVLAIADTTRGGTMSYGISFNPNYRYSYLNEKYPTSMSAFSKFRKTVTDNANKTTGFQINAGTFIIIPDLWFPTLGISIKNIPTACVNNYKNPVTNKSYTVCGSKRTGNVTDANTEDAIDPTEVRVGFGMTPRIRLGAVKANLRIALDAYPLPIKIKNKSYGFSDLNINEVLHAGTELFFGNALGDQSFAIRGGLRGSNFALGATLGILGLELEYATYPGYSMIPGISERKDRRHLIGITSSW